MPGVSQALAISNVNSKIYFSLLLSSLDLLSVLRFFRSLNFSLINMHQSEMTMTVALKESTSYPNLKLASLYHFKINNTYFNEPLAEYSLFWYAFTSAAGI